MIVIASHKFAHRLIRGGIVESAPLFLELPEPGTTFWREEDFSILDYSVMSMTDADLEQIRIYLETLNTILRPDYVLPSSERNEVRSTSGADAV